MFCKSRPMFAPLLDPMRFTNAFKAIDTDKNGMISLFEFRHAVESLADSARTSSTYDEQDKAAFTIKDRGAFRLDVDQGPLDVEVYAVEKLYWKEGVCQYLARSEIFQNVTLAVIVANAIYIGIEVWLENDSPTPFFY